MENPVIIDCHTHLGVELLGYVRGFYPYAQDWPTLAAHGKANGIGRFIVFPMVSNLAFDLGAMREGRIETEGGIDAVPYSTENRRMMIEIDRYFADLGKSTIPFWIIDPSRECREQAEILRRLREEFRCSGFKIQATVIQSPIIELLGKGSVLLDLAAEWDVPVLIHSSILPSDQWSQASDILRIAEARPEIRFCLAHSCRFDRPSLDRVAELPNTWFDCSAHRIHCELAVAESPIVAVAASRFPSDYRDPARVLGDLASAYGTKLMWGTDAPYDSYVDENITLLSTYGQEADALHAQGAETVERIAHLNTLAFLGSPR